jgi:two-component system chemotaxis response regulator CheB
MNWRKIRVLVVDDSATVRKVLSEALNKDPQIEVVGTACDAFLARDKIVELQPDVITLDVEMPRMDGITFLKILMKHRPMPVVVVSAVTKAGSEKALEALQAGAVEVIGKPNGSMSIGDLGEEITEKVKIAAQARVRSTTPSQVQADRLQYTAVKTGYDPRQIILMGASTGGTEALKDILTQLPAGLPGICIVQHIHPAFSKAFADRLNQVCKIEVREAADKDLIQPGLALVAPSGCHMLLRWYDDHYRVQLKNGPMVHHQRPAVDVLFNSAADWAGKFGLAILLTGMGKDGAIGMQKLKNAGSKTIAQDEATCTVFGMPRAAIELGAVDYVLPLPRIPQAIMSLTAKPSEPLKLS